MDDLNGRAYQFRAQTRPHQRLADVGLLHYKFRGPIDRLAQYLTTQYKTGRTETLFKVFETYRGPERQDYLFSQGATKALSWQSAHQYGLACDFVGFVGNGWTWDPGLDWDFLKTAARQHDLDVPISWDRGHVQSPYWMVVRNGPLW